MGLLWDSYNWEALGAAAGWRGPKRWVLSAEWTDDIGETDRCFYGNHRWVLWTQMVWWVWSVKYPGSFFMKVKDWADTHEEAVWPPLVLWLIMTIDLPIHIIERIIMYPPRWLR